jgi:arabinose-5-phosphate isomerase
MTEFEVPVARFPFSGQAGRSPMPLPASEEVLDLTPSSPEPTKSILYTAARVLRMEAEAILALVDRLGSGFERAADILVNCRGKVVVTGMGKSGHIGCKIAATLASTGTPAFFVHPAELRHGDFGMLDQRDAVLALSGSGETQEIKLVLDPIKRLGLPIISFTGNLESTLAKYSDAVIDTGVQREACPLNLAPTSSTTAALAMGDALAVVLMTSKGFKADDFARSHPGGNLGRMLLTVTDVMRTGVDIPQVQLNADYATVVAEIDRKRLGLTCVVDANGKLNGIITDGDVRRALVKWGTEAFLQIAASLMTAGPKTIRAACLAVEALKIMETHSISDLLILDELNKPAGVIHLKDLLRAGIV